MGGNAGTTPGTHYLGTSDDQALELKVNAERVLRLEPTDGTPNLVGGYSGNTVTAGVHGAVIAGGGSISDINSVTDHYGTVGGGWSNRVGDNAGDLIDARSATVAGGLFNYASGAGSTIGGGAYNYASGAGSTIGGGNDNHATRSGSTVGGGSDNEASGDYSFVAGNRAKATFNGAFVWADSSDYNFTSLNQNTFSARATGGFLLIAGINPDSGAFTWGCALVNGSSWTCSSDRAMKENFQPVDSQVILDRLSRIPVQTWNAKGTNPTVKHLGPTAQDFYAAFGLGDDDKSISTIDLDGVSLVAIQGLYKLNQEHAQAIEALQAENTGLHDQLEDLNVRVAALEQSSNPKSAQAWRPGYWLLSGCGMLGLTGLALRRRKDLRGL